MTDDDFEILEREKVYQGYFSVDRYALRHRTFEGDWSQSLEREIFERGHSVGVLPYDPHRDEVVLLEQFRVGAMAAPVMSAWQIECVAGIIEPGHTADETAIRECQEEINLTPRNLRLIHHYLASPGGTTETLRLYCAEVDAENAGGLHGLEEEGEYLKVWAAPAEEAFKLLADGKVENSMTLIALMWLQIHRPDLQAEWG